MSGTFNDAPDSYFAYVESRIQAINPSRKLFGPIDSMDWPPKKLELEAFYLILLSAAPLPLGASQASPFMTLPVQWSWIIKGTDLQSGIRGRSRGDRGRTHREMMAELVQGCYPGQTEKKSYTMNDTTGLPVATSFDPVQYMSWSLPSFGDNPLGRWGGRKIDESGVIYGYATVYLSDVPVTVTNQ